MDVMDRPSSARVVWPALVSVAVCLAFAGARLVRAGGDAVQLAELGTRYADLDPQGTEGYDGQFTYMIAADLNPQSVAPHLDRPAYRYQRVLLSLLARSLALGNGHLLPWMLLLVGVTAAGSGTAAVARILLDHGQWEGYALGYGLWVGVVASVGLFLHEALAYGLVALGWLALHRNRTAVGAATLALSLFAKETTLPFVLAALSMAEPSAQSARRRRLWLGAALVAFLGWQVWLWLTFGQPGLGSGGAMSTPFEMIPLMGFVRIGGVSLEALGLFLIVFGPMVLLPTVWGLWAGLRRLRLNRFQPEAWALVLNAAMILFVPFSTAREPLGLVRLVTGLVLAVLLFAAIHGLRRVLNYSLFWTPMLAMLIRR
jgi:hypothetical protein